MPHTNQAPKNSVLKKFHITGQLNRLKLRDAGVATAFVGAIAVLLLVACYVISRLSSDRAYRQKWQDYNDCGWA